MKCKKLMEMAEEAAKGFGLECEIEKATDVNKVLDFGAMSTPGLPVHGKLLPLGHLPGSDQARQLTAKVVGK